MAKLRRILPGVFVALVLLGYEYSQPQLLAGQSGWRDVTRQSTGQTKEDSARTDSLRADSLRAKRAAGDSVRPDSVRADRSQVDSAQRDTARVGRADWGVYPPDNPVTDTARADAAAADTVAADTTAADTPGADTTTADTTQIEPAEIGRVPGGRSRGDRAARVVVTAAELLTPAGSACPAFPRPPSDRDPRHGLVVAVALAVDSLGQVDTTNVRVVQAPGTPPPPPEFFPQVYIVSTTLREEGEFDGPVEAYDSLVAGDVRRHLATLRFRPASKGGRPTRATVLVSCQAR